MSVLLSFCLFTEDYFHLISNLRTMKFKRLIVLLSVIISGIIPAITNVALAQGVGVNTSGSAPDNSAILDVSSTNQGLLLPRMTTAQRNAIVAPAQSLLIFNTTTSCFEYYFSGAWYTMACPCAVPLAPVATAATAQAQTGFTANWTTVSGATGYFLDVSTNSGFSSFVSGYNNLSVGSVLTYNVTGLTCGTTYYYRVRAGNSCGTSVSSNSITAVTAACGCTTNLDQQQTAYQGGESARNLPGYSVWQSFTAGHTGMLVQIDHGYFNAMTGTATLKIYSGSGTGGTLLYSAGVTISGTGNFWQTFLISPAVAVTTGQVYTFEIVPIQGGGLPDPYGVQVSGPTDMYGGGRNEFGATWDDVFKTYVCY
jgi:hypothetical protein